MKTICFLSLVFFISCNEQSSLKTEVSNKLSHEDSLKFSLIGKWGDFENPMWDFKIDSIYYFEPSITYPYKIIDNDLVIYFPESQGVLRNIRVIKDTLLWLDDQ